MCEERVTFHRELAQTALLFKLTLYLQVSVTERSRRLLPIAATVIGWATNAHSCRCVVGMCSSGAELQLLTYDACVTSQCKGAQIVPAPPDCGLPRMVKADQTVAWHSSLLLKGVLAVNQWF